MAEQPVQRFCWPGKAIDWPEPEDHETFVGHEGISFKYYPQ